MNTLSELKNIILKSSNTNETNNLISLRAFLFDEEDCPWALLDNKSQLQDTIEFFESKEISYYKKLNEKNIRKLKINPIEIYLLPYNKRKILIELINDILDIHIQDLILLQDKLRADPFKNDSLMEIIMNNNNLIDLNTIALYKKRKNQLDELLEFMPLKKTIVTHSVDIAIINKIKNIWMNSWGISKAYNLNQFNSIDNLLI